MQRRYWNKMSNYRFILFYLSELLGYYNRRERVINIVFAITSSSAIAGWAIWQEYQIVWTIMIAVSQVLSAIDKFLPYKSRIKKIMELHAACTPIYNEMEYNWFNIGQGEMTEVEINDLIYNICTKWTEIENALNDKFPEKKSLIEKAQIKKTKYFEQQL